MTEAEYLASVDPAAMLAQFVPPGGRSSCTDHNLNSFPISSRKLVLFKEAVVGLTKIDDLARAQTLGWDFWYERMLKLRPADCAALLRCVVGNPWRPAVEGYSRSVTPEGHEVIMTRSSIERWRTDPTVTALARAAYDDRRFEEMGVLADALEEAGCTDAGLLGHLRETAPCGRCEGMGVVNFTGETEDGEPCHGGRTVCPACRGTGRVDGGHARGCWVLDLILGKE